MKKVGVFKIITDGQNFFFVIADTVESAIKVAERVMDEFPYFRGVISGVCRDETAWAEGGEK